MVLMTLIPETQLFANMESLTFVEAIKNKYVAQEEFDDRLKIPKDSFITTEITLVGLGHVLRKQRFVPAH